MHDKKQGINMHNLLEQWRERGSLSKAGSRMKRADYDVETSRETAPRLLRGKESSIEVCET